MTNSLSDYIVEDNWLGQEIEVGTIVYFVADTDSDGVPVDYIGIVHGFDGNSARIRPVACRSSRVVQKMYCSYNEFYADSDIYVEPWFWRVDQLIVIHPSTLAPEVQELIEKAKNED